jgi:hypothetical protein
MPHNSAREDPIEVDGGLARIFSSLDRTIQEADDIIHCVQHILVVVVEVEDAFIHHFTGVFFEAVTATSVFTFVAEPRTVMRFMMLRAAGVKQSLRFSNHGTDFGSGGRRYKGNQSKGSHLESRESCMGSAIESATNNT